eukprot:4237214-Amphidinium_carterae.1
MVASARGNVDFQEKAKNTSCLGFVGFLGIVSILVVGMYWPCLGRFEELFIPLLIMAGEMKLRTTWHAEASPHAEARAATRDDAQPTENRD